MTDNNIPAESPVAGSTGKGRPTPKRRDAQPRRGGPVTPPPTTRREAAKRVREQGKAKRQQVKGGARAGSTQFLLKRDQGPVRALVRDVVDSRRHVSVLLLPAAVLPLLGQATGSDVVYRLASALWAGAILAALADFVGTALVVRRRVRTDFPDDTGRGNLFYATMRTAQFRRLRVPKPRVQVGEQV